jgi:hypothetical protein
MKKEEGKLQLMGWPISRALRACNIVAHNEHETGLRTKMERD